MPIRFIDVKERYPDFGVRIEPRGWIGWDEPAEFTDKELERIKAAEREYGECQELIEKRFEAVGGLTKRIYK